LNKEKCPRSGTLPMITFNGTFKFSENVPGSTIN
jgi:hypothetical protein